MMGILTRNAIPMHLRNSAVYGHNLELIGLWPHSRIEQAKLGVLWGQECRITVDGGYEIVGVEKARLEAQGKIKRNISKGELPF